MMTGADRAYRQSWRAGPRADIARSGGAGLPSPAAAIADPIAQSGGGRLQIESTPAADDSDTATRQTVEKMCAYIKAGVADPLVVDCAAYAWRRFGVGLDSPAMKCWAVFWWVKHCIRFRQDEATMFRAGLRDEQDLLIAPALLVRMKEPAEDCDGFTMLGAAMLSALNVPVYIATVAASPDDPARWSHVFPVAVLPGGGVLPLDMSHGVGPGWMIPRSQIFRWQAWDLNGRPVSLAPRKFQGLHGYVRSGRGMGSCDPSAADFNSADCMSPTDLTGAGQVPGETPYPVVFTPPPPVAVYGPPVPAPANTAPWWQLAGSAENLLARLVTPPAYQQITRDAYGNVISTTVRNATGATALTAGAGALSSNPIVWIGGGLLLALAFLSVSKR